MDTCPKTCSKCAKEYQHPVGRHGSICRPCKNASDRAYRQRTSNAHTHAYEKTPKGFVMRTYRNMQSRVTEVQEKKAHLYLGLALLTREEFYAWALTDPDFIALFRDWTVAGWEQRLTPSIDRIDTSQGYVPGNIRWLTHSENSRLGSMASHKKAS